jgi:phage gp29-like protein
MAATPPLGEIREIPLLVSLTDWDNIRLVKSALWQMEQGVMLEAANLLEMMLRDDRIAAVIEQRFLGLLGLPMDFAPGEGDPEEGSTQNDPKDPAVKALKKLWPRMFPRAALYQWMIWGQGLGVGLAEQVWEFDEETGYWYPRLKVWHPRYLRWDWSTDSFHVVTRDGGDMDVRPGDPKWAFYTPFGHYRGWMHGFVRSLAIPWLFRQWGMRDWIRYSEVYGAPIRGAVVPEGADETKVLRFLQSVTSIGRDVAIKLPQKDGPQGVKQGFDLKLIEAAGRGWEGFEKAHNAANGMVAIRVLGQNLTTEIKAGSFAAATIHQNVKQEKIDFDSGSLTETQREQVLAFWAEVNFGSRAKAPRPAGDREGFWETEPPEDQKAAGDGLKAIGDGIVALQATGAQVDVDDVLTDAGVPITGPAKEPPKPTPPAGAGPGGEGGGAGLSRGGPGSAGAREGQIHADRLAGAGSERGAEALRPELEAMLREIAAATDPADLQQRIVARYGQLRREDLELILEKVSILAELAGRWAVQEDL